MMNRKKAHILSLTLILVVAGGPLVFFSAFASQSATIDATVKVAVCGSGTKETGEQCDGGDFAFNLCTAYGFSGGVLACQPSCELNTSGCTTDAEVAAIPLFFTGVGGSYELENSDGATTCTVDVDADAYSQDLRVHFFSYDNEHFSTTKPAPGNLSFIGKTYDIIFVNEDGFVVTTLAHAASLVLSYRDEDASGLDEGTIQPYRWGASDAGWQPITGAVVDTSNNTVTFETSAFSSFALFGSPPQATPAPSGGGGGGFFSGGSTVAPISVVFRGSAYPRSEVTLLRDAVLAGTVQADSQGRFSVTTTELTGGLYAYLLYTIGDRGLRSALTSVALTLTPGITHEKTGIILSPTVAVDKPRIKQSESLVVSGNTAALSQVTVVVRGNEEKTFFAIADADGRYQLSIDTASLPKAAYLVQARASLGTDESALSRSVTVEVGDVTELDASLSVPVGDVNADGRVNLVDFSILAYWYKRPNSPLTADMNRDGKVDLVDVSIMIYHWTG